jgi:adenosylcobinamide-GDP ribazoletransferase
VNGFVTAARYLTIVPLPSRAPAEADSLGRAAPWFPVVGVALGVVLVALDRIVVWLFPSILAALLTVTAWKLLTGGLHLDGLADCLDGLMGRDRDHRLAIMRDSRIGVFGAVGLILVLLLELTALAELPVGVRWRALLAAPAIGRAMPPLLAAMFPPARPGGQGAAFTRAVRRPAAWIAGAVALAASLLALGAAGVVAFAIAAAIAVVLGSFLARRLGGLTGDGFGAAVEIAELTVLLVLAAAVHLRLL